MMKQKLFDYPLFSLGFRPFFILAGLSAIFLMLLWNAILHGKITTNLYYPGTYWHAHEMLIGYSVAVIAGFLLTAVRNWTGLETVTGEKLAGLCLLWLYGRLMPFYADAVPDGLIALVDIAFLPWLAYLLFRIVMAAKQVRNLIFIGILKLLALGNMLLHLQFLGITESTADTGIWLMVATLVILILIVAGRVFPFFTERGLLGFVAIRNPQLDGLALAATLSVFCLQLFHITGTWLALTACAAAVLNGLRLSGWHTQRIWYVPLLWILYIGYGWIMLGFVLTALAAYNIVNQDLALHAFTLGGVGVLTLGMMARVALGHTGRALKVSNIIAIAFVLLNLAAVFRVLLPALVPSGNVLFIYGATLLWLATFALFTVVYLPILTQPRKDAPK